MDILQYKDSLRFSTRNGIRYIYDPSNKMWRQLMPEEVVRQCLYQYMLDIKGIPAHMMKIEYGFKFIENQFRADLVVFNKQAEIKLIAECKSFQLNLKQKHLDQLAFYNQKIKAAFLILSNGRKNLVFQQSKLNNPLELKDIPTYKELVGND